MCWRAPFSPALIIALLGSIDSLLTSLIADSMTRTRHNPNRELVGQGIGNMVAGLIGGLPGAGATMGTVVNIRAGGRTQLSGALRRCYPARHRSGPWEIRRGHSPCGPCRHPHESRLGHHRLAFSYPYPPRLKGNTLW